uniref:Uncharacterized protein n=1 Tax=Oryza glumipatula TaxID=40148 RepID=A0A0D9ZX83_9ORYZ
MVYARGIGQWLTRGGGINDGIRQSELEKMMLISVHDASFSTVLEGGVVARLDLVQNDGNGDEITTTSRRARPKAGDDVVAFPLICCTIEDQIKRRNLRNGE